MLNVLGVYPLRTAPIFGVRLRMAMLTDNCTCVKQDIQQSGFLAHVEWRPCRRCTLPRRSLKRNCASVRQPNLPTIAHSKTDQGDLSLPKTSRNPLRKSVSHIFHGLGLRITFMERSPPTTSLRAPTATAFDLSFNSRSCLIWTL